MCLCLRFGSVSDLEKENGNIFYLVFISFSLNVKCWVFCLIIIIYLWVMMFLIFFLYYQLRDDHIGHIKKRKYIFFLWRKCKIEKKNYFIQFLFLLFYPFLHLVIIFIFSCNHFYLIIFNVHPTTCIPFLLFNYFIQFLFFNYFIHSLFQLFLSIPFHYNILWITPLLVLFIQPLLSSLFVYLIHLFVGKYFIHFVETHFIRFSNYSLFIQLF